MHRIPWRGFAPGPRYKVLVAVVLAVVATTLAMTPGWDLGATHVDAADVDVSSRDSVSAGRLIDGTLHSGTLAMDLPYRVYLPPGYSSTQARYPVLYMLHGGGSNHTEWTEKSHLGNIVDYFITSGQIPPLIIVMPEGSRSYYMNWPNGGPRWADYMVYDLVSFIDFTYRTLPEAEHRAIGGMSMGGTGALQLAMNHPEVFSTVGAHSAALPLSIDKLPDYLGSWQYYATWDPIRLTASRPGLDRLQIWLDVGEQDDLLVGMQGLDSALQNRGVDHKWHVYPGGHDNSYWMNHIPTYLRFYTDALTGRTVPPALRPTPTPAPPTATPALVRETAAPAAETPCDQTAPEDGQPDPADPPEDAQLPPPDASADPSQAEAAFSSLALTPGRAARIDWRGGFG